MSGAIGKSGPVERLWLSQGVLAPEDRKISEFYRKKSGENCKLEPIFLKKLTDLWRQFGRNYANN